MATTLIPVYLNRKAEEKRALGVNISQQALEQPAPFTAL